jgi:hypothetical protein
LERIRLQDGTSIAEVVALVQTAVAGINAELAASPLIGGLAYQTTERTVRYRDGGTSGTMDVHTEYGLPVEQRAAIEGHMLPRKKRDLGLAWTWDYLNDAIMDDIRADIQLAIDRIKNEYEKAVLTRLFTVTHNTVETSGYDVGLADGNQSTVIWTPPNYDGQAFASSHTHANERAALSVANVTADAAHLREHGHMPPYILLFSEADRASWTALSAFVRRQVDGVQYGSGVDIATVSDEFIGVFETDYGACLMKPSTRIPTGYYALVKSYGQNHPRNSLRWWYNTKFGQGVTLLPSKQYRTFPIEGLMMYSEYGFGGNDDRTNGAVTEIGSGGTYTSPTIS